MRAFEQSENSDALSQSESERSGLPVTAQHGVAARDARALDTRGVLALQRVAGNASVSSLMEDERSPVLDVIDSGGGRPLDSATRTRMEGALGADFSDVRVHTDTDAAASAQSVRAKAYTVGEDIAFQAGEFAPSTENGQRTLAHELTHVLQQREGPVEGTPTGGGIAVSHPSDRHEQQADANASRVVQRSAEDELVDEELD